MGIGKPIDMYPDEEPVVAEKNYTKWISAAFALYVVADIVEHFYMIDTYCKMVRGG